MAKAEVQDAPGFSRTLVLDVNPEAWKHAKLLVMAACDSKYLGHALALIRSLDMVSPGFDFLLHLINVDNAALLQVTKFRDELTSTTLHVSAERVTLEADEQAAYFASARFIRLAELMGDNRSTAPIFVTDADAIFVSRIDFDFTSKPNPDLCIYRRSGEVQNRPAALQVAAGAVWASPSEATRVFFAHVGADLLARFGGHGAKWFVDQEVLAEQLDAFKGQIRVFNIKRKYIDWQFKSDSVLWTGKGSRKSIDLDYLLLRSAFDANPDRRERARRIWNESRALIPLSERSVLGRIFPEVSARAARRIGLFLPRLDLPWKKEGMSAGGPLPLSQDAIELRLWWKRFSMVLAQAMTRHGWEVVLREIPAWEIQPGNIDDEGYDLAFVPHRCRLDYTTGRTPVLFYMQEYYRHVFTVDAEGWSAASSVYPVDASTLPGAVLGAWDDYRERLRTGKIGSKFEQGRQEGRKQLIDGGKIPQGKFAFFPLQVPHDQSIRYFSDHEQMDVLDCVIKWSERRNIPLVVKAHPANPKSAEQYRQRFGKRIFWSDANVLDLVRTANGVITLNSGVGFEAVIAGKPVVTFARAEYDCVTHRASLESLDQAWSNAVNEPEDVRLVRYSRFVDWFLARYAVDLSRSQSAMYSIEKIIRKAGAMMSNGASNRDSM